MSRGAILIRNLLNCIHTCVCRRGLIQEILIDKNVVIPRSEY